MRKTVCPRCKEKYKGEKKVCDVCNFCFDNLKYASNKKAKQQLLRGKNEHILMTNKLPNDVNKFALICLTIFFGIFGAHLLYVGRFKKAIFYIVCTVLLAICSATSNFAGLSQPLVAAFSFPIAVMGFMWISDIFAVLFFGFKVPIAVDFEKELK